MFSYADVEMSNLSLRFEKLNRVRSGNTLSNIDIVQLKQCLSHIKRSEQKKYKFNGIEFFFEKKTGETKIVSKHIIDYLICTSSEETGVLFGFSMKEWMTMKTKKMW